MMTHAYKVLEDFSNFEDGNEHLKQLAHKKGAQLVMSEASAAELEIEKLVEAGILRRLTDEEALKDYKGI
jgi:hypothetical protein